MLALSESIVRVRKTQERAIVHAKLAMLVDLSSRLTPKDKEKFEVPWIHVLATAGTIYGDSEVCGAVVHVLPANAHTFDWI